jgi:acetyl esterase/lipase
MQAPTLVQANADRFQIDPDCIATAGDSARAQIAAQISALVTTPGYADAVGMLDMVGVRRDPEWRHPTTARQREDRTCTHRTERY